MMVRMNGSRKKPTTRSNYKNESSAEEMENQVRWLSDWKKPTDPTDSTDN